MSAENLSVACGHCGAPVGKRCGRLDPRRPWCWLARKPHADRLAVTSRKSPARQERPFRVPKLSSALFTHECSADNNRLFVITHTDAWPFMDAKPGWKIIGHGKAPYAKEITGDFAVMVEKVSPAEECGGVGGEDCEPGRRVWHHFDADRLRDDKDLYS